MPAVKELRIALQMGYRYIGSKARIADEIIGYIQQTATIGPGGFFIDAFSGTGAVAERAAQAGWPVYINDMMASAVVMSEARLLSASDVPFASFGGYAAAIRQLNCLPGEPGFIWREYSPASAQFQPTERRYFTEENAMRIDAISAAVHAWRAAGRITRQEYALLLSDLIRAANDVANIAGTYGCFLSRWTAQAQEPLRLQMDHLKPVPAVYRVSNCDVFALRSTSRDLVYLDPPYTKRQYASYYHIPETIVCGDQPAVSGVSGLRPWKDKSSVFCYKTKALDALSALILQQGARRVVLSYSNEGHIQLEDLVNRLSPRGQVDLVELKTIGRYRPNKTAVENSGAVREYLVDFHRRQGEHEQTANL